MESWYRAVNTNLQAPETLLRVHDALLDGPVFGYWYRAHSGGGQGYVFPLERIETAHYALVEAVYPR